MATEAQIAELLVQLLRRSSDLFTRNARNAGLTVPQVLLLRQIFHEPKTIGQIVEAMQLSYSTVSGIIDRLERDGWLARVRDDGDRRIVWICKTDKLDEGARQFVQYRENYYMNLLKDLPDDELNTIRASAEILLRQMKKRDGALQ